MVLTNEYFTTVCDKTHCKTLYGVATLDTTCGPPTVYVNPHRPVTRPCVPHLASMVHYVRFLKTARVEYQTSKSVSVIALITITSDLGDTFLFSDANLTSRLIVAEQPGKILSQDEVQWHRGSRELSLRLHAYVGQNAPLVRLHVSHAQASGSIPSILDAWSAPFELLPGSRAAALVERKLSLPGLATLMIWEETGNSIGRHIWYSNGLSPKPQFSLTLSGMLRWGA
jgi:hypothetical protein